MLEKLKLYRFKCHEDLILEFDQVTTIVGVSDSGKSAALQGVGWITLNQPPGDEIIQHGEKDVLGVLYVDGRIIKRKRGKENSYSLDGKVFKAFGIGQVPEEIRELLNISEANFQWQFDPPFWLAETPGQVSRNLNQIVNLEVIDKTLSGVASELRKARSIVDVSEERLKAAREERSKLRWVEDLDKDLRKVEEKWDALQQVRSVLEPLMLLITQVKDARDRVRRLGGVKDGLLKDFEKLDQLRRRADEVAERRRELDMLIRQVKEAKEKKCQLQRKLQELEDELHKKLAGKCPLCGGNFSPSVSLSPTST